MSTKANSDNEVATENNYAFAPIPDSGKVNVQNLEYGEEEAGDHIYTVTIENGQAVHCTCPGHKYGASRKHQEAVENTPGAIDVADPDRCSNGHDFCPGPAAIDTERGPAVGEQFACIDCWMNACRAEEGQ